MDPTGHRAIIAEDEYGRDIYIHPVTGEVMMPKPIDPDRAAAERAEAEAALAAERPAGSLFDQFMASVMQPVVMVDNMVRFGLDLINDPDPDTVAGKSSIAAQTVGRLGTGIVACTAGGVLVVYGVGRFALVTYESGGAMSGEAFAELCVYGYNGYTLFAVGWDILGLSDALFPIPTEGIPAP